jgi:hypothetical protein
VKPPSDSRSADRYNALLHTRRGPAVQRFASKVHPPRLAADAPAPPSRRQPRRCFFRRDKQIEFYRECGAARGTRTPDPRITNAMLYRLSYCGCWRAARWVQCIAPTRTVGNPLYPPAARAGIGRLTYPTKLPALGPGAAWRLRPAQRGAFLQPMIERMGYARLPCIQALMSSSGCVGNRSAAKTRLKDRPAGRRSLDPAMSAVTR